MRLDGEPEDNQYRLVCDTRGQVILMRHVWPYQTIMTLNLYDAKCEFRSLDNPFGVKITAKDDAGAIVQAITLSLGNLKLM